GRVQQPVRHEGRPDPRPAGQAARGGADRGGQGVHRRSAPRLRDRRAGPRPRPAHRLGRRAAGAGAGGGRRLDRPLPERAARLHRRALPGGRGTRSGDRAAALQAAPSAAALGLQDRVRTGHQALHGRRRTPRRPVPRAPAAAHRRAGGGRPRPDREGARGGPAMRTRRVFHAVDSHTEGMPTRVITGGVGTVPGASMAERRIHFRDHLDHIRKLLVNEPRGHAAMSGAILQPPTRPDADWGVLFIEVSGLLPMCGHGTIGVATVLVETGMVEVTEPVTTVRLEVPAGLVVVDVAVRDGAAMSVTLRNVPSYADRLDAAVTVPGYGEIR